MITDQKKQRLEFVKEIYEGRNKITDLQSKFSEEVYNNIFKFLKDKKFIKVEG